MYEKIKGFLTLYKNAGYHEPIFQNYDSEITLQNHRMVKTTSFIGSIMMTLLTIISLFMSSVSKVLPLYLTTALFFIGIYVISRKTKKCDGTIIFLCNYGFLSAAFFFAIGLDIIQRNPTATTVCVLLVALPLLIVDKPWREMLYFAVISIVFMIETTYIKQSPKASIDVLNAVSFYSVGTFLGYKHNQMVLRNILNQKLLETQRDTDTLTTLYNKGAMENKAVSFLRKMNITASMIILDMDNFKYVNDTYGHQTGDELLIKMGKMLLSLFYGSDLISRFGGDEFIVFLPMTANKEDLKKKAEQILQGVNDIRIDADPGYRAHVCIGISLYPDHGGSYEELFEHADSAMYQVKKHGKDGYAFYDKNHKQKILVVDDIEMNRMILKRTLCADYDILEAEDGRQALQVLREYTDVEMVITDIVMPNMDGLELISNIRSTPDWKRMAVIACTQFGDKKQQNELFKLGIDDFVYKASSPQVIQIRVRNVMKSKKH